MGKSPFQGLCSFRGRHKKNEKRKNIKKLFSANTCLTFGSLSFFTLVSSLSRITFESRVICYKPCNSCSITNFEWSFGREYTEILLLVTVLVSAGIQLIFPAAASVF